MTSAARRVAPSPAAQGRHTRRAEPAERVHAQPGGSSGVRHTRRAAPAERVHAQPGGSSGVGGVPERSKERG